MENILDRAIIFATKAHEGQFRKGTQIPYILHPMEAAAIVGTMTTDEEIIAGAVLHDVVEDTDTTVEDVINLFGARVGSLVASESENKREELPAESTWKVRKQETLDHLKTASIEVKMITLGDKLSNVRAIYRDYQKIGDELWQRFNQKDRKEHYWYYSSIAECLPELCEYQAYKEYCELVEIVFIDLITENDHPMQILRDALELHGLEFDDIIMVMAGVSDPMGQLDLAEWVADHPEATVQEMIAEGNRLIVKYEL